MHGTLLLEYVVLVNMRVNPHSLYDYMKLYNPL
jgi:hypothetical protein